MSAMSVLRTVVLCGAVALSEAFVATPLIRPVVRATRSSAVTMSIGNRRFGGKFSNFNFGGNNNGGFGRNADGGDGGTGDSESSGNGDDESGKGGFAGVWKAYNDALEAKPIFTKGMTSLVGFSLGDLLAQSFLEKDSEFNLMRLLRLASFGALIHGPSGHWFYGLLDSKIPGVSAPRVIAKVFIDQVIWNPIFGCLFFSYLGLLETGSFTAAKEKTQRELLTAVTGSWKVWPIAHAINFRFIPNSQRLLYINSIQIFYNCFLSIIGNR